MQGTLTLNRTELRRYLTRIGDRWRLEGAYLGGTALTAGPGERPGDRPGDWPGEVAADFTVVLVSDSFDEVPWLERVHVARALWDVSEMGSPVNPYCYTRAEFERKRDAVAEVRDAVWHGLDLLVFI